MGYPQENLHSKEELVLDLHPHWWFFTPSLVALAASMVFGLAAVLGEWSPVLKTGIAVVVLGCLLWFGVRYAQWATTDLVLTTDRLIWRTGVISKRGIEIPLERINTIFFSQRIMERIIGVGDLRVESASTEGAQVFENMKKPQRIQNEIYIQMEANENRKYDRVSTGLAGAAPAPKEASVPEQIAQLAELRDQGHISPEEFETKKAELLGRM
jgi:uncharacterized membrane protein YdbT with pleckstrin-like domain